jgi:mono/diheme cytochrome c family protein
MSQTDPLFCRAKAGPEARDREELSLGRRTAGRALLAISMFLIVAGLSGTRASAVSISDRDAGAELFKQIGCEHCHGPDGIGTDRGPSLATVGKRLKREQIEHQILDGGKQMPPFEDVLTFDETRKLVDYLAHKKKAPKPLPGG